MRSLTFGLLLLASVSLAQQPAPAPKPRVQTVEFLPSDIGGVRQTPLVEIYMSPLKKKFDCIIKVRMNFNDKLRESVHEM